MTILTIITILQVVASLGLPFAGALLCVRYVRFLREAGVDGDTFRTRPGITLRPFLYAAMLLFVVAFVAAQFRLFTWLYLNHVSLLPRLGLLAAKAALLFWFVLRRDLFDIASTRFRVAAVAFMFVMITGLELALIYPVAFHLGPARHDPHGVVLQSTWVTCVPSALASAVRWYGNPCSERDLAILGQTSISGSFLDETIRTARAAGFPEARFAGFDLEPLLREDRPFLLSISTWVCPSVMHAVIVIGAASETLRIADPLLGLQTVSRAKFLESWQGFAIRLGPPGFAPRREGSLRSFRPPLRLAQAR